MNGYDGGISNSKFWTPNKDRIVQRQSTQELQNSCPGISNNSRFVNYRITLMSACKKFIGIHKALESRHPSVTIQFKNKELTMLHSTSEQMQNTVHLMTKGRAIHTLQGEGALLQESSGRARLLHVPFDCHTNQTILLSKKTLVKLNLNSIREKSRYTKTKTNKTSYFFLF